MSTTEYNLAIGEPWDFESPDGENTIMGIVERVLRPDAVIFRSNHKVTLKESQGNLILLSARYRGENLVNNGVIEGEFGGYLISEDYEGKSVDELQTTGVYGLIGGIEPT